MWKDLVLSLDQPAVSISKQDENLENKILKKQLFMEGNIFSGFSSYYHCTSWKTH